MKSEKWAEPQRERWAKLSHAASYLCGENIRTKPSLFHPQGSGTNYRVLYQFFFADLGNLGCHTDSSRWMAGVVLTRCTRYIAHVVAVVALL